MRRRTLLLFIVAIASTWSSVRGGDVNKKNSNQLQVSPPAKMIVTDEEWKPVSTNNGYEDYVNIFFTTLDGRGEETKAYETRVFAAEDVAIELNLGASSVDVGEKKLYMKAFLQNCGGAKNLESVFGKDVFVKRVRKKLSDGSWDRSAPFLRLAPGTTAEESKKLVKEYLAATAPKDTTSSAKPMAVKSAGLAPARESKLAALPAAQK